MIDFLRACGIALGLFLAFGAGAWLEQGGKSDPEDYSDE